MKYLKIYTDGGSRGNPGPGAIGIVIKEKNNQIVFQAGKTIGRTTNNQAEYRALITALEWLKKNAPNVDRVDFFLDSKLVVYQMRGEYKIKSLKIRPLWQQAKNLEFSLGAKINYHLIPRSLNYEPDFLLNQALDQPKTS